MSTAILVAVVVAAVIAFTALQVTARSRQRRSAPHVGGSPHQAGGWPGPPAPRGGLLSGAARPLGRRGVLGRSLAALRASRRHRARNPGRLRAGGRRLPGSAARL
ncbi:MAG TPA: hypothetical protein VKV35_07710 [Streptosporangiaceae bacterium]|nr:hypothetical protein [Streptosporangiaceae bacterium]